MANRFAVTLPPLELERDFFLAADVLDGRNPATIPVENMTPSKLQINRLALKGLRDPWMIPESALARADIVIDETGRHAKTDPNTMAAVDSKTAGFGSTTGKK